MGTATSTYESRAFCEPECPPVLEYGHAEMFIFNDVPHFEEQLRRLRLRQEICQAISGSHVRHMQFMILHALARRPGHVKTREQLMNEGYPHDTFVSDRTIDSHIKRIRKKFAAVDDSFDSVETVYGLGYRYTEESA